MVMLNCTVFRSAVFSLIGVLAFVSSSYAAVTARVDRPSVDLNESFVLQIIVDNNIELKPDFTVLDDKFVRRQHTELSNTTIVGGQLRRDRTWSVLLMAKSTGRQEIPAITVGNEKSEPISIIVNEATHTPPGEADVFITSEVDQTEVFVQSQVLYRFKVYRAVATRQEGRRDPVFSGAEVLVERAGDERSYEAILNGRPYSVIERVLAIYPQASGEVSISPALFEARVLRNGRITGRKVFESEAHVIEVLPIPAPPAEFPDAAWLPARDVQLSEEWSREPREIAAGEPVTRKITVTALGQIETQIPAIEVPLIEGMNVYEDKPDLSRINEAEGIRGIRRDQYAMIGVRGGAVDIPEVRVPWWNIEAGEWRVARLPSRTIQVDAPVVAAVAPVVVEPEAAPVEIPQDLPMSDGFWKRASQLIAAIWLLTVLAWWWSSRERTPERREPEPPPVYKQQAKFVKAARKAAGSGDKAAVRAALIEWARLQWPQDAPRNIGDLAARVAPPLRDELQRLSANSYGVRGADWDGAALAKSLRSIDVMVEDRETIIDDPLPPLMPSRS